MSEALRTVLIAFGALAAGFTWQSIRTAAVPAASPERLVAELRKQPKTPPAQMMQSLGKLAALPDATQIWCGHEYTERNLCFAHELEPANTDIADKLERVRAQRKAGNPTVPSTIGEEKRTNPFLRFDSPELRGTLRRRFPDLPADPVAVFAKTRELKDQF